MDASEWMRNRAGAIALAALALAASLATIAAPARAASAQGGAEIRLARHEKGRTLSGQGVTIVPTGGGGGAQDGWLKLPIDSVEVGADPRAGSPASLAFRKGGKSVALTDLRFDLEAGTLTGKLDGEQMEILRQGAPSNVDSSAGSVSVREGKLRLIRGAARVLQRELGLKRALGGEGVGMIWLAAQANPTHGPAQAVTSGVAEWGFLSSWRAYVLGQQGPPMSKGTITVEGGATANGNLSEAGAFFRFPAAGGSFEQGLYGATDKLVLKTSGSVEFAKPFHCIIEIKLADLELTLDGPSSSIVVGDYSYDIDEFNGMGCNDKPAVLAPGTKLATLDPSGVTPTYSADGKTVTWSGIPATLTAAGSAPFQPTYEEGQALDPVTISVGLG
jgi:Htaa